MENSFMSDNIFILLRNKINEAYEESKARIETKSLSIMKIITQIKNENEAFCSKCIDIIKTTENYQNSAVRSVNEPQIKRTNSKGRNDKTQQPQYKYSPISKQDAHSLSKNKKGNQSKPYTSTPTHSFPSSKTTTSNELSKHTKVEKPQIVFNINKIKKQELKSNFLNANLLFSNKNSFQYLNQSVNCYSNNSNANVSSFKITHSNIINTNEQSEIIRDENRKMTTNESRKFSIIDIPCLNIEEENHNIKNQAITSKATPKSNCNPKLKCKQMTISTHFIKQNTNTITDSKTKTQQSMKSNLSQLCYIMAKEK